jgi:CDP-glucose 4,6-dehydratase
METLVKAFWRSRRVFLTGHTGFKGSWLALRLTDLGASVTGYALPPETKPNAFELLGIEKRVTSVIGDIRNGERLRDALRAARPEIVMHLAAQPLVRRGYREPHATFETNVMGTVNLLEAVRSLDVVKAVLVVTSDKTYANHEARPQREEDPLGGDDPYSASKACAEIVSTAYRRSYYAEGPWLATARAGNVIGGGDFNEDRLVADLVRAAQRREAVVLRYPSAVRPWQFVGDAIEGYLRIAQRLHDDPAAARAWNLGPEPGPPLTVLDLARRFLAVFDPTTRIEIDSRFAPPEAPYLELDATAARERLSWQPRYDAGAAIDATAAWYRGWLGGANVTELASAQMRETAASAL